MIVRFDNIIGLFISVVLFDFGQKLNNIMVILCQWFDFIFTMNTNDLLKDALNSLKVVIDQSSLSILIKAWINYKLDNIKIVDDKYYVEFENGDLILFNKLISGEGNFGRNNYPNYRNLLFTLMCISDGKITDTITYDHNDQKIKYNHNRRFNNHGNDLMKMNESQQNITIAYLFEVIGDLRKEIKDLHEEYLHKHIVQVESKVF